MATNSINNFLVDSPNTNGFRAFCALFGAQYKSEGIIEGFYVKATGANNSVQIVYSATENTATNSTIPGVTGQIIGFAAISLNDELRPIWEDGTTPKTITFVPNTTGGIVYSAICIKINDNDNTNDIVFVQGTAGQDPNFDSLETAGIKYLPIARIKQPASSGVITQSDIDLTGTCNTGDFRPIGAKAVPRANKGFRTLTQTEEDATTFSEGDKWTNTTTGDDRTYLNGQIVNLKATQLFWTLTSPLGLGTYSVNSSTSGSGFNTVYVKTVRTSPVSAFEDVFNGVGGTGSFVIPANSLRVGDVITIQGQMSSTYSNYASGGSPSHGYQWRVFVNDRTISANNLNPMPLRYTTASVTDNPVTTWVRMSASQSAAFPETLKHPFRLEGTVVSIGASGQIRFMEVGDFWFISGFTSPGLGGKGGRVAINDIATIDTTIANTLIFDFDVIRTAPGAGFNPTITLNSFIITKN